jgi:4-hydroxythreonine-4-phosphate dehydrogenase
MRSNRQAPLGLTMGDPAGIGAEVILKTAAALSRKRLRPPLVVIGDVEAMRAAASRLGDVPTPVRWDPDDGTPDISRELAVLNVGQLPPSAYRPGRPTVKGAAAAYDYVVTGAKMALGGEVSALVTAPLSKQWLSRAGHHLPGHSELLARLSGVKCWRMMFVGRRLRVALVTVHMRLSQVPRALTRQAVFDTIHMLDIHMRDELHISRVRIAVLGLNPHAGEGGLFGDEEIRTIGPAISQARRHGIEAFGPLAPDSAFVRESGSFGFDAAVAMYHDQGLIAVKSLEFAHAVNVTLGLPFVRTSPDHGTAFDIAGSGSANPASMIAAVSYAWRLAKRRAHGARGEA